MSEENTMPTTVDPEGLVGVEPSPPRERGTREVLVSPVWGNVPMTVLANHGREATWLGNEYPEPCTLYAYAWNYCMEGCTHPGMDIAMPEGTELHAIEGGNVFTIRNPGVSGSIEVRVRVANGDQHLYNHMSRSVVNEGQDVAAGDLLGFSGVANSPHLHFELRRPNGSCTQGVAIVNPKDLLTGGGDEPPPPPPPPSFAAGDRIKVVDPPLRFRTGPGLDADIIEELDAGVELVVVSGPQEADGYAWYQATKADDNTEGWLAGKYCARVTA